MIIVFVRVSGLLFILLFLLSSLAWAQDADRKPGKKKGKTTFNELIKLIQNPISNAAFVDSGKVLITKEKIRTVDSIDLPRKSRKKLEDWVEQDLNARLLGTARFKLWLWFRTENDALTLNRILHEKLAEPPYYYDAGHILEKNQGIYKLLFDDGYFDPMTQPVMIYKKPFKAHINYQIQPGPRRIIDRINYNYPDPVVALILNNLKADSYLKSGKPFTMAAVKSERQRITDEMNNNGYMNFNKSYVLVELDTINTNNKVHVSVDINPPTEDEQHIRYVIDSITVISGSRNRTSTQYEVDTIDKVVFKVDKKSARPYILNKMLIIEPGQYYQKQYHQSTLQRLSELGIYRYVNISFRERCSADSACSLYPEILLIPGPSKSLKLEFEANTGSDYDLGTEVSVGISQKNMFRLADIVQLTGNYGIELDTTLFKEGDLVPDAVRYSAGLVITLPTIITPFGSINLIKQFRPRTRINFQSSYIKRRNLFTRTNNSMRYGFIWNEFEAKTHSLFPVNLTFINTSDISEEFQKRLEISPVLKQSFTETFISSVLYLFNYNSLLSKKTNPYLPWHFDGKLELAGSIPYLVNSLRKDPPEDGQKRWFGRIFSQFILAEAEIRGLRKLAPKTNLVGRFFGGLGIAFGNSLGLPFIRQFGIGGPNSIRAFPYRGVGPGTYQGDPETNLDYLERIGDIRLEGNIELRQKLSGLFEIAFFYDAGNVWLRNPDLLKPGAKFDAQFLNAVAMGTGLGLRLDFSYFILRLDLGIPVYDPSKPEGSRWQKHFRPDLGSWRGDNLTFNLAIGYPF